MRFIQSVALLSLTALGLASPVASSVEARGNGNGNGNGKGWGYGQCMHANDAQTLVDAYVRMISGWNDADAKYLAESFRDTSDSINQLAGKPLGSDTFNKQSFIDHQHEQPDNLPIQVRHQSPTGCNEVALIWDVTFGVAQKPVRGITILTGTKEAGYWQIQSLDVEFNNIAYLLNIGGSYKMPGQA
ncbi:SnoaL-like domain-containing protein [Madurella fahalii]|uniref:SnoaL-like domain-containing protein n=1 Tax=Madurella fahalii TaxID=1157608 RepID=A0ABQ0GPQ1_9PEZI